MNPFRQERRFRFGFVFLLGLVVAGGSAVLVKRWQEYALLRAERDLGRSELREEERVLAENARLRAIQIPTADLERLRADHAALPRLRAELDALARGKPGDP